jgi:hypothetical protein
VPRYTFVRGIGLVPSAEELARYERDEAARQRERPVEPDRSLEPVPSSAWSVAPFKLATSPAPPARRGSARRRRTSRTA